MKREFSIEDIGECLLWLQRFGVPGTGEPCCSSMGFLMHAMGDVLRAVRAAKAKRVQAEEFERKVARFLQVFPDAESQEEIVADYCRKTPWVPKGNVARRLAIQDWWDRVYGSSEATSEQTLSS